MKTEKIKILDYILNFTLKLSNYNQHIINKIMGSCITKESKSIPK